MGKEEDKEITHIDNMRVKKLEHQGHLPSLHQEFETLKAKLLYGYDMDKKEALRLVALVK